MPLTATNFVNKGPVLHNDLLQFYNLFTGVMVDQPVTFKNTVTVGGNQGSTTVPVKLYGAIGQTSHLLDLYTDNTNANPGWGIAAVGSMAWGPGGASPVDTFLSRVATQNGHATDTAGVLVSPYLEVAGPMLATSYQFPNSATLSGPGANPFRLVVNQDLMVNRTMAIGGPDPAAGVAGKSVLVIGTANAPNAQAPIGIDSTAVFKGVSGQSAGVSILTSLGSAQAVVANETIHGMYLAPAWLAGGFTGLTARGITLVSQALPTGFAQYIGILIGAPTGGTTNSYSLGADGGGYFMGAFGVGTNPSTLNPNVRLIVAGTSNAVSNYASVIQVGGTVNSTANGDVIYGLYHQPTLNAAGHSSVGAYGMIVSPVIQGSPANAKGIYIGQVTGGATTNYSLHIATPSGSNAYALVIDGGGISLPANSVNGSALVDASVATTKLAANAVSSVAAQTAAPAGSTASASYVTAPEPFGVTGIVINVQSGAAGILIWGNCQIQCTTATPAAPVVVQLAVGFDSAIWMTAAENTIGATSGYTITMPFCVFYATPPVGQHRITLYWASANSATLNWSQGYYSHLMAAVLYR